MMGAIDAVCDSARRIIGTLAARSHDQTPLPGAGTAADGDRPPTAAMKKFAASLAKSKGIKPPRGYTKSTAVCRAFLDEHAGSRGRSHDPTPPADRGKSRDVRGRKTASSTKRSTGSGTKPPSACNARRPQDPFAWSRKLGGRLSTGPDNGHTPPDTLREQGARLPTRRSVWTEGMVRSTWSGPCGLS